MTINDGGPAFPKVIMSEHHLDDDVIEGVALKRTMHVGVNGLSIRDWFAGQALIAVCAPESLQHLPTEAAVGQLVYEIADGVIAARNGLRQDDDPRDPDVEYDRATEYGVRYE